MSVVSVQLGQSQTEDEQLLEGGGDLGSSNF